MKTLLNWIRDGIQGILLLIAMLLTIGLVWVAAVIFAMLFGIALL